MQNKGLITVFAIALGLASLYQLSFTWVANNVASDAEAFAAGDANVKSAYLDSMMSQEVYPVTWVYLWRSEEKGNEPWS